VIITDSDQFETWFAPIADRIIDKIVHKVNKQPDPVERILSRSEVLEMLGISSTKLWQMLKNHELSYSRVGRKLKFRYKDILEMLNLQKED
jgi:excisionase family DNA binding protein